MAGHGLLFRSLDLQDGDDPYSAEIWLDIWNRFEPAEVRGDDLVIPQKPGMTPMTLVKHRRVIELRGHVRGIGEDRAERQEAWRAATEALMAVMDYSLAPGTLEIVAPYQGLASGSESIEARAFDAIPGPVLNRESFQRWTFRLRAIADEPEWLPGS